MKSIVPICSESVPKIGTTGRDASRAIGNRDVVPSRPRPEIPFERPVLGPDVLPIDLLQIAERQLKEVGGERWQWAFAIGIRRHVDRGFPISEKQVGALLCFVDFGVAHDH